MNITREEAIRRIKAWNLDSDDMEVLSVVVPELVESDDEKIRKELIDYLAHRADLTALIDEGKDCKRWIAYLERQKEQKPFQFKNNELVDIIKGEFGGFRTLLKKKGIDYEPQRSYWEGFARLFDSSAREYVKEQKPAEWSDNFEDNIRTLLHDKLTWHSEDGSMSSTVSIDDKTLKDIISGIWFYVGKEALKYPNKESE